VNKDIVRKLRAFVIRNVNYNWSEMSKQVSKKLNKLKDPSNPEKKLDHNYVVVLPKYTKDEIKGRFREEYR
jgi:hypothetical protein